MSTSDEMGDGVSRTPETGLGGNVAAAPPRPGKLFVCLMIGLLCFVVYMCNFRSISAGDAYPARYLPFAIWQSHTVLLDPIVDIVTQGRSPIAPREGEPLSQDPQQAFWVVRLEGGHAVSLYPVIVPLLVSPLYLPAVAYLHATGADRQSLDRIARIMEKISATLVAALSAVLLFLVLRRRLEVRPALLLTLAYAFGTTTWVISSQALWQHGVGELLVVCALFLLTGRCTRWRALSAGVVLGLIACNRPPDALISAALGLYALWWARKFWPALVAGTLLPVIPTLVYNIWTLGMIAGAYGLVGKKEFFENALLPGLAGLLFSPAKGLFVFSPFLIFVPFCVPHILCDKRTRGLGIAILAAVILQLLLYGLADWRQGASWGPRWLTDLLPLLVWMLIPVVTEFGRVARAVFVSAIGAAIVIETIGAFWYTGASDVPFFASANQSDPMQPLWELRNAPFMAELRHAHAPFELTTDFRGSVDVIQTGYGAEGREISVDGWALADGRTPDGVEVLLDGHRAAPSSHFSPRLDVSAALRTDSPSGWHVTIPAKGLGSGKHVIAVIVRANPNGIESPVAERSFDVNVPSVTGLAFSAHLAADILASRQPPSGYWLTSYTAQASFENAHAEMNTYLPSVMVDMLSPVADAAGVQANVQRARDFLSGQIEASGLVRYHGLPNAPTIGTLGCAITPDADDTALVWRIAPGARSELLADALKTISAFRTADGLYRTWLAPQDRYQCIDPGSDPDPADIAIQMHVYLLLSKVDPPAAKALCAAIERAVDDDRVWVYYKSAPLMPILRQADLREAGCSVQLPVQRQQTAVPGQELWISAAQMLDRARGTHASPPDPAEIRDWLQRVSADEFALVRRAPPLLYHNDQTASVSRYYWSEEFGYALWLRLYFEQAGPATGGAR